VSLFIFWDYTDFIFWDYTDYFLIIHELFIFSGVHEVAALSFTDLGVDQEVAVL